MTEQRKAFMSQDWTPYRCAPPLLLNIPKARRNLLGLAGQNHRDGYDEQRALCFKLANDCLRVEANLRALDADAMLPLDALDGLRLASAYIADGVAE